MRLEPTSTSCRPASWPTCHSKSCEAPSLVIKEREAQLARYHALPRTSVYGQADRFCREIGKPMRSCDQYGTTGFPSDAARVWITGNAIGREATNGAWLWDKLILIQGPHNQTHIKQLWHIAAENQAAAIVRLGPVERYRAYTPKPGEPLVYSDLAIRACGANRFSIEYNSTVREDFPVFAYEEWGDFQASQCENVHDLILQLDALDGPLTRISHHLSDNSHTLSPHLAPQQGRPVLHEHCSHLAVGQSAATGERFVQKSGEKYGLIIHCRGGFGRTGTFAACWKIYQEYKAARLKGEPIEIDPAAIVDEIRMARTSTVQTETQFLMILEYVDFLNRLESASGSKSP